MTNTILQKVWSRPALIIFSKEKPIPVTASIGQYDIGSAAGTDYIYLTDDNRSPLDISINRIEFKKRMINGRMRSYHVADKKTFSVSWENLPSSMYQISEYKFQQSPTGWAGGKQIVSWHDDHTESFYLTLVYDQPNGTPNVPINYELEIYNVFFDEFSYTVSKRGQNHDLWNISLTLVEV